MFSLATKFVPRPPAFEMAQRAGHQAAEFWSDADLLLQGDSVAEIAGKYPFRYALHFPNGGRLTDEVLRSTVKLYQRLNCTALIIHQPMFDRFAEPLRQLLPGIDLAVENHLLDENGFEEWAEKNPGLTLDVEHLWKFTLGDVPLSKLLDRLEKFLCRHAAKLQHVHLLGYLPPNDEEHHPAYHNPQLATEVFSMLANHGFSKLVVSEADVVYQTDEDLKKDVALFSEWLKSRSATSSK